MTKPANDELRELEDFIGREIYGLSPAQYHYAWEVNGVYRPPTTDKAHAMEVLAKCAEKCVENKSAIVIEKENDGFVIDEMSFGLSYEQLTTAKAETLPLAIAKFAKALYSKKATGE